MIGVEDLERPGALADHRTRVTREGRQHVQAALGIEAAAAGLPGADLVVGDGDAGKELTHAPCVGLLDVDPEAAQELEEKVYTVLM